MTDNAPLLSVVATSRNDDHGHNLLRRTQIYVNGVINQCQRHNVTAELILVDWNPPNDRPGLADVLQWPADPSPCQVRVIQVPPELHSQLRHSEHLPLFQMIAKNVGIRRARGRFVLATNIDIVFNDELFAYIAANKLDDNSLYRIDRHDVASDVPLEATLDEQLAYCRTHLVRVNALDGAFPLTLDGRRILAPQDIATADDGLRLGSGWFPPERDDRDTLFRWAHDGAVLSIEQSSDAPRTLCLEVEPGMSVGQSAFELEVRHAGGEVIGRTLINNRELVRLALPPSPDAPFDLALHVIRHPEIQFDHAQMLDFRVYHVGWLPTPPQQAATAPTLTSTPLRRDVAPADADVTFGTGCYVPEYWEGLAYRWVGPDAEVHVTPPPGAPRTLMLELEPGPAADGHPVELDVSSEDGTPVARGLVHQRQQVWFTLPADRSRSTLRFRVAGRQLRLPNDVRTRSYRVTACRWEAAPDVPPVRYPYYETHNWVTKLDEADIADPHTGVWLGRNWGGPEVSEGRPARWIEDNAEITIISEQAGEHTLELAFAAGPGADGAPLEVQVLDEDEQLAARGLVRGRREMFVPVTLEANRARTYRLHVIGGGARVPHDPRVLNLLVFHCGWCTGVPPEQAASRTSGVIKQRTASYWDDIAPPDAGIGFGRGWYEREADDLESFRWAANNAELIVRSTEKPRRAVALDIEPGPGVDGQPFELQLRDEADNLVDCAAVAERGVVSLTLPLAAEQCSVYRLCVPGGGQPLAGDPRTLNFRVFNAFWVDADAVERTAAPTAVTTTDELDAPAGDIVDQAGAIELETGWSALQTMGGAACRTIADRADLTVRMPGDTRRSLVLDVAPSDTATPPVTLEVRDAMGNVVKTAAVAERQRLAVALPGVPGQHAAVGLVVPAASSEPHAPALRVYRCHWGGPAPDPARTRRLSAAGTRLPRAISPDKLATTHPARLHTFACGDFTMMARARWFELRGYAEFELYSWHIDSLLCHSAVNAGLKEVILTEPMRIYHIEHSLGSGWTPAGENKLFGRLAARGIPFLDDEELWTWMLHMRRFGVPMIFNREDWGLAAHDLPEVNPGR